MLVLPALLSRFSTMADGGARLQLDTSELTPDQFKEVGSINKKHGVFVFKPDSEGKMTEEEVTAIKDADTSGLGLGDKKKLSKSQTLRAVFYKMWKEDNEGFETQEAHYNHYMDTLITHFNKKLTPQ